MSQQVQRGYEVAPLHQLAQGPAAEGVFCYLEARLLGQQAQVHQDLMEEGGEEENKHPDGAERHHISCGMKVQKAEYESIWGAVNVSLIFRLQGEHATTVKYVQYT